MRYRSSDGHVFDAADDAIGADGLLKDGHRLRVPMQFRDSAGRVIVDEDEARRRHRMTMYDPQGRVQAEYIEHDAMRVDRNRVYDSGGALVAARPGFVGTAASERIRRDAYEASKQELRDAWKAPSAPPPAAPAPPAAPRNPRQPISVADAQAIRDAAYREMCDELTNAWRRT
jgi:hypothetical protein